MAFGLFSFTSSIGTMSWYAAFSCSSVTLCLRFFVYRFASISLSVQFMTHSFCSWLSNRTHSVLRKGVLDLMAR